MRKPPKPNKTGILLLSLLCVFVVLLVLYLAVLSPFFAETGDSGSSTPTVSTKPGEGTGLVNGMVMMFPRVERADMSSIRVFNSYDEKTGQYEEYCFTKDGEDKDQDGDTADFIIEGHPVNIYNEENSPSWWSTRAIRSVLADWILLIFRAGQMQSMHAMA